MKKVFTLITIAVLIHSASSAATMSKEQLRNRIESVKQIQERIKALAPKTTIKTNLKTATGNQKMLDKISYDDSSYKTFAYNEAGLLIAYKNYLYNALRDIIELQEQQEFEYDKEGNETLFINRNLDLFDGFIILEKREATYNANNFPKEEILWSFDNSDKELKKTRRSVYTLSDENNATIEEYSWNGETEEWKIAEKITVNFSNFEHPNSISTYYWSNQKMQYDLASVIEFKYNDEGLETERIEKMASEDTGELSVGLTITTTYNSDGNRLYEKAGGTLNGEEITVHEQIYTYEDGLLIAHEYKSTWGSTKQEYSYTNGKLSERRDYYPVYDENGANLGLSLQYRDQFIYDSNISVDDLAYPSTLDKYYHAYSDFCDPFYFQSGAIESTICFSWDYRTEEVIEDYRGTYHYSDFKAGIQNHTAINPISDMNLEIGPNPCTERLNIRISDMQSLMVFVYNTSGQLVYNSSLHGQSIINTSSWEKGIYILSTQSEGGISQTMKLIKE